MKKKPATLPGSAEFHRNPRQFLRAALIVAAYLCTFILLDFFSQQFEELRGIVAWYPPAGLIYTLLLVFGVRFTPAVTIALFISSVFIYHMPQPPYLLFLWALIISLIYGLAAAFLRNRIRFDWQLRKSRDMAWLVATVVFVSALLAVLSVSSSALSSDLPRSEVLRAIFLWWIGETVGVLTVTPFLLIHVMPWLKRFTEGQPVRSPARRSFPRPTLSIIGQAFSIVFLSYWVFGARGLEEFRPMYLIALPIIWIAVDHGLKGVTIGIVALNFGLTLTMWFFRFDLAHLGELQLLMIVSCIVGLVMGAVVTERRQTEETLRESEEGHRMLVEQASDGIFLTDNEGRYIEVNSAGCHLLGYTRTEILQKTIHDLAKDAPNQSLVFDELRQGKTIIIEREMIRQDGTLVPVEISAKQMSDGNMQGIVRDISERKKAEENILLEKNFSTAVIDSLPGLFYIYDDQGKFLRWNKNVETISGYSSDEILNMSPLDFFEEPDKTYIAEKIREVFVTGKDAV